jgi:hypothetical protein
MNCQLLGYISKNCGIQALQLAFQYLFTPRAASDSRSAAGLVVRGTLGIAP